MPVDIEAAVRDGYGRTVARNGLLFVGIFYLLSLLNSVFSVAPSQQPLPPDQIGGPGMGPGPVGGMQPYAPSLGLSPGVAGVLSLVFAIVSLVITIAAIRTFVSDETEQIPREFLTHNVVWAILNLFIGSIIFGVAVAIGFVLLIIPGLFLLISLFFWQVYVVEEDQNFIEGFRNSWGVTRGHRLRLFLLGIAVAVIAIGVSIVFGIPGIFLPDIVGFLIAQIGSAFLSVFFIATLAQTYNQLIAMKKESALTE